MTDHRPTREDDNETTEDAESFVARWSRRKHRARGEIPTTEAPARESVPADEPTEPADSGPTDADLPPPESLDADSDYSGYLSGRVSEELRRAALRKLFRLPQFNIRDGLDDYDENYRNFSALGDIVTADMRHHEERRQEQERLRAAEAGDADETGEAAAEATPDTTPEAPDDEREPAPDADARAGDEREDENEDDGDHA